MRFSTGILATVLATAFAIFSGNGIAGTMQQKSALPVVDHKALSELPHKPLSWFDGNWYTNKLLSCTQDIIWNGRGARDGILFSADVLDVAVRHQNNQSALSVVLKQCQKFVNVAPKEYLDPTFSLGTLSQLAAGDGVKKLLKGYIDPKIQCSVGGLNLVGALIGAVGVRIDVASCRDTFGRRWLEVRPGVELGVGLGLHAGGYAGSKDRDYAYLPVSLSSSSSSTMGLAVNVQWQGDEGIISLNRLGFGGGGIWSSTKSAELNLQFTPAITNFAPLRNTLFGLQSVAL